MIRAGIPLVYLLGYGDKDVPTFWSLLKTLNSKPSKPYISKPKPAQTSQKGASELPKSPTTLDPKPVLPASTALRGVAKGALSCAALGT